MAGPAGRAAGRRGAQVWGRGWMGGQPVTWEERWQALLAELQADVGRR